jgi:hypothetical protein
VCPGGGLGVGRAVAVSAGTADARVESPGDGAGRRGDLKKSDGTIATAIIRRMATTRRRSMGQGTGS